MKKIDELVTSGDAPGSIDHSAKTDRNKAIEAASFVIIGFGLSQVVRLLGNIILTRLLVPELFGIITLARVFISGLYLFSDVGLEPAIIRSKRSSDTVFLNTAWTIQVLRSLILATIACVIAFPAAAIYNEPVLKAAIPAIGIFSMIGGFQSTSIVKLDRELQQRRLTIMELIIQVASLVVMIISAYFFRNIWALLIGELIGSALRTFWSHAINKDHPNKLVLDRGSVRELLHFGKWILVSTAMMFLASQADRIIFGKLFTMAWFGVYSVAVNLAELPRQISVRLSGKVLFPLISRYSHYPREELREKLRAARGKILAALGALLAVFACFGDIVVRLLFDNRYSAGEWILPLLAIGMWPLLLILTIDASLLAIGKPKYAAIGSFAKVVYMVILIPVSFILGGELGAVIAVVFNDLPSYVVINYGLSREGLSLKRQDLWTTLVMLASVGILISIRLLFGMGIPGMASFLANG